MHNKGLTLIVVHANRSNKENNYTETTTTTTLKVQFNILLEHVLEIALTVNHLR